MENIITYVAMDTHKKQHKIALHHPAQEEIVEFTVKNTVRDIRKMVKKIIKQAPGQVKFCYEAELLAESQDYKEIVGLLSCFHGIQTLTAITIITEIFEFGRFETPRQLMSYLGLTPSEDSSGEKQRKGAITKAGNKRARRLLNESAWHNRHRYYPSKVLKRRRKGQPQWAIEIADAAGRRLSKRYRHLINNGKMSCKANVAVARELAGFIWFMITQYQARKKTKGAA